ncbi:MAG: 23S rRNA (pseudouridine(1915)-N(3))-methyltransferase RlmH [Bordetella sp.]
MKLFIVAVTARQPAWLEDGVTHYLQRFPKDWALELKTVRPESRQTGKTVEQMMALEAQRIENVLPAGAWRVVLDEKGQGLRTTQFAEKLQAWQQSHGCIIFIIGGPDGLASSVKEAAHARLRLSDMTLPHGLVKLILAEQLYRAYSLLVGHPYHRE